MWRVVAPSSLEPIAFLPERTFGGVDAAGALAEILFTVKDPNTKATRNIL